MGRITTLSNSTSMQLIFQHIASTPYGMRASTMGMSKSTTFEALSQAQQTAWIIVFSIHFSAISGKMKVASYNNANTFITRDNFHLQHESPMPTSNLFQFDQQYFIITVQKKKEKKGKRKERETDERLRSRLPHQTF